MFQYSSFYLQQLWEEQGQEIIVHIFFPFTEKVTSRSQLLLMGELKADAVLQAMDQTNSFG